MEVVQIKNKSVDVVNKMLGHRFQFDMDKNFIVIHTPYKNLIGDLVSFYLVEKNDHFLLSDDVDTFRELGLVEFNVFKNEERKNHFEQILKKYSCQLSEDYEELFTTFSSVEELPQAIENLHECIEQINGMFEFYRLIRKEQ